MAAVDRTALGTPRDQVGPLQRKLESFGELKGLVFGAFGEASEDVHDLVNTLSQSRLRGQGLVLGREGSGEKLGIITGQVRHALSTVCVRAQARCLLSRFGVLGEGQVQASRRRQWARREEDRMRDERRALWVAQVRGMGVVRRGQFLVP